MPSNIWVLLSSTTEYSQNGSETHTTVYYGSEALRVDGVLRFILTDHGNGFAIAWGSTSVVTNGEGEYPVYQGYDAPSGTLGTGWGKTRFVTGVIPTDKQYTGQRISEDIGLYDYKARWGACPERQRRNPLLGRFLMEDTIINNQGVMRLDRYAGMRNNPVRLIDPSGHVVPYEIGDQ